MSTQSTIDFEYPPKKQADDADSPEAMRAELSGLLTRYIDDPQMGWARRRPSAANGA